jgi:transcriptional repressor NrdR
MTSIRHMYGLAGFLPYIWLLHLFSESSQMRCPYCHFHDSKVLDTSHDSHGGIRRRRECFRCKQRFSTYERPVLSAPLIIKQDGTREEFDREKLERGIRIACAKRPVSAADIERLVGQIESELQRLGKSEVSSRVIGDMVIAGLKETDQIAYIRYAIVYLRLDDLGALRKEIDSLLKG